MDCTDNLIRGDYIKALMGLKWFSMLHHVNNLYLDLKGVSVANPFNKLIILCSLTKVKTDIFIWEHVSLIFYHQ